MRTIVFGSDHAGFGLKNILMEHLKDRCQAVDVGTHSLDSCDYPLIAGSLAREVLNRQALGILICGSGIGVSMAANKVGGVRCALCTDCLQAEMTRRHNDANMMALGAGITGGNLAKRMVEIFLNTEFEGGRHARRVALLDAIQ